ncbi:hypothetical protein AAG570_008981 [Ranatra chinensis]|uniref:Transcription initiation factor IIA subunit 1 n=1 Tax=Ranatra chinensis TaxID=642074 RepID=A0ABD0YUM4_9HEMI
MDEGVDEQVLMELKHTWETRLQQTKAVEVKQDVEPQPLLPAIANQVSQTGASQQGGGMPIELTSKNVSIQITIPQQGNPDAPTRGITIQVPASALQGPIISASMALPQDLATSLLQAHVTAALQGQAAGYIIYLIVLLIVILNYRLQAGSVPQLDGHHDTSDDDDDDDEDDEVDAEDDDDDDADEKEDEENDEIDGGPEEEPLNSGDDVSEEDPSDLFETDNVVVCQYDKITRSRNKWKFYLKDGIMNLGGKDYVFQKSNGDAEW